ncbi:DNA-binding protein [Candidatus Magnetominusculus dajiuhuensis]|uniref:DNA-binding protein n=1 Tax=Candidatus Magnetominusculus dajiuhuensis TaxID=3137712 RepID=UPI003B438BDE
MAREIAALALILLLLAQGGAVSASSQPWRGWKGSGGWGSGDQYQKMYDTKTVDVITGAVEAVETFTSPVRGMSIGILLILKTGDGTIAYTSGFIERQDVKFDKGDTVEVRGAKATFDGSPAIIAAEVKKGGATLRLRDENGLPRWAGLETAGQAR